jgi:hypothetical protein
VQPAMGWGIAGVVEGCERKTPDGRCALGQAGRCGCALQGFGGESAVYGDDVDGIGWRAPLERRMCWECSESSDWSCAMGASASDFPALAALVDRAESSRLKRREGLDLPEFLLVQWKSSVATGSVSLSKLGFQQTAKGIHLDNLGMSDKTRGERLRSGMCS